MNIDYISIQINKAYGLVITVHWATILVVLLLLIVWAAIRRFSLKGTFEIDEAEFGFGNQRIKLRPNNLDRQIAYEIWVELSTRKIGLDIDLDHDVIYEIYESWYKFFSVTRDLIKKIPATKFRRNDTQRIVYLSIEVLNVGLRPHLTKWQARFRHWFNNQLETPNSRNFSPQELQKQFPEYKKLSEELLEVNKRLMLYRDKMYQIINGK